ncbi:MAG: error-prone DNA polymerase [Betaproteobacteria bacterium]|nr:error-prone DNA polymerase [Betaproteobacteria bacterium]
MPTPAFAELHCLTNFSFLRGASHAHELVARAAGLGYRALAVTDECSLAGVVRAHEAAKEHGLHLVIGAELQLCEGTEAAHEAPRGPKLVLLACHREGYGRLCGLISLGRRRAPKGGYRLGMDDLGDGLPGCLALLVPRFASPGAATVASPASRTAGEDLIEPALAHACWLGERFPDAAWIAAALHRGPEDAHHLECLHALAAASGLPVVAANDVHMHVRGRRALQDVLTAIRAGMPVAQAGHALFPNGERHLRSREVLAKLYPPAWLAASVAIAERCTFSLDELRYEYPDEVVPAGETPASWLRRLTETGLAWRYAGGPPPWRALPCDDGYPAGQALLWGEDATCTSLRAGEIPGVAGSPPQSAAAPGAGPSPLPCARIAPRVRAQVEHELALIAELGYEPYFLTVYDIVRFARSRGILCQGRGSAANSAVCYALGITEVDPARLSMLFERFISKERNEPPDIDVDFEHQRREEVIQYLYARYGRDRAALAATVITYRTRSALRDVGKALGLDLAQVERIAKNLAWWDRGEAVPGRLRESGFDPDSPRMRKLLALTRALTGFPRHLSQHTGGFVISRGPLARLVPVENAAMAERTVIQWDKDDLDALGLLKVDVLALGMLSAIRRALELVSAHRGREVRMQDIPPEDAATYAMLCRADSVGVFQIESRAQMSMLPRLKPRTFYDLVIEVAIVRPGPIQGGMVHPYLRRRQGLEPVSYPSDEVRGVLERTLGVPIFQEQVMQLAIVAAGFSPGEADRLRRSMAAWRRKGGLEHYSKPIIDGMMARGYRAEFAEAIFRQILGFGEYGFPESHAASFALLVYVSAWLKCHEPAAFCAALLNSQPMGFYAPAQLVQDARRHGVTVLPVDALASHWDCTLEPGAAAREEMPHARPPALRLGLRMVAGLSEAAGRRLVEARHEPFESLEALARRAGLTRRDLDCLAAADAFESLAGHRRAALWAVAGMEAPAPLLREAPIREPSPQLPLMTEGEAIVADYASLGLTLGRHPLVLLRPRLVHRRMRTAAELGAARHGSLVRTAGLVTCRQRPGTASGVVFVTLEDETGCVNVVVWSALAERQRRALLGARLLGVHGTLERQGDVAHLIAGHLVDLSGMLGELLARSRDFH